MRRRTITLERARHWAKLATNLRNEIRVDPSPIATAALFTELELARMVEDYESMLVTELPDDLAFIIEDYKHESGIPAWEAEYARQVARALESKARTNSFYGAYADCSGTTLERHESLLWTDSHSTAVILLRNAWILLTFSVSQNTAHDRTARARDFDEQRWSYKHFDTANPYEQAAHRYLDLCLELTTTVSFDAELADACAELHEDTEPAPVEFVLTPSTRTVMHSYPVAAL
jgi:hypothetical protein